MIDNVLNGYGTAAYSVCDKMPWYNPESEVEYDPEEAKKILEDAGWKKGTDGIRKKDGVRAEFTLMFSNGDSVRQALAEDTANQLRELGIEVTTEGVGWMWLMTGQNQSLLCGAGEPIRLWNFIIFTIPWVISGSWAFFWV